MKYIAGYNQPGYLPESEPEEFDTFDEAKDYIVNEIEMAAEDFYDERTDASPEDMEEFADEVRKETDEFSSLGPDGYAYWVTCEN